MWLHQQTHGRWELKFFWKSIPAKHKVKEDSWHWTANYTLQYSNTFCRGSKRSSVNTAVQGEMLSPPLISKSNRQQVYGHLKQVKPNRTMRNLYCAQTVQRLTKNNFPHFCGCATILTRRSRMFWRHYTKHKPVNFKNHKLNRCQCWYVYQKRPTPNSTETSMVVVFEAHFKGCKQETNKQTKKKSSLKAVFEIGDRKDLGCWSVI